MITLMKDPSGHICKVDLSKLSPSDVETREKAGWKVATEAEIKASEDAADVADGKPPRNAAPVKPAKAEK